MIGRVRSFQQLLLLVVVWSSSNMTVLVRGQQECGGFFTSQCRADHDVRYNPLVPVDLPSRAKAWSDIPGLYQGTIYEYNPLTMEKITETDFFDTSAGKNQYQLSPSVLFLNITVNGTRAYRHMYQIMAGRLGNKGPTALPGGVNYCDAWSVATWEKDGTAKNMKSVCARNEGFMSAESSVVSTVLLEGSLAYPLAADDDDDDESGVLFVEKFKSNNDPVLPITQLESTFLCTNVNCTRMSIKLETYENGQRTNFQMGDVLQVENANVFAQLITQTYGEYYITDRDKVMQPMTSACLNRYSCPTKRDFRQSGDPEQTTTPYQEPDADVNSGAIVTLVFGILAFFLLLAALLFLVMIHYQKQRCREFFAVRMAETMETKDKPLSEFTTEELANEYKVLQGHCHNEINKDNLYEFLSCGPNGYMDYRDYGAFWPLVNKKRTGVVDFLEFCSILAHCHKELEEAKRHLAEGNNND